MQDLKAIRCFGDLDIVALIDQLEIALLTKQNQLDVALEKINKLIERSKSEINGGAYYPRQVGHS